jgi:hypothetical protein
VREYERKQLLERVERDGATVGRSLPESVEVQGEEIDLRQFVFEIKRRETIPPGEQDRVDRAKRNLRRERRQRLEQIEENRVSFDEGEELVEGIVGIDRALNALEQLRPVDLEAETQRQEAADQQRWVRFLRKALGREDSDSHGSRGSRGPM